MKILIINPNSDLEMTEAILHSARMFADGEYDVDCMPTPGAPKFIETHHDATVAAPGMIELACSNENNYDAFIVACHCDPNLDVLKEIMVKPVVGIGEASMKLASMLGHTFSVISTDPHSIPNKEAVIRRYHLEGQLASVKAPKQEIMNLTDKEKYSLTAKAALEEDMAEVIVLGCAGMAGLDRELTQELGVPVLDGVCCALFIAAGLVKGQLSTSKRRKYNPLT